MDATMNDIWTIFMSSIDVMYIIMCNIATYAVIKMISTLRGKDLSTSWKRIISAVVAIILGITSVNMGHDKEAILYGFFIQFIVYDYLWKWAIKKLEKFESADKTKNETEAEQ